MRLIDFTKIGGYRLKQKTFRYMQESYYWILKTIIGFLGLPNVGNFIIYGCQVSGANITSGMMYIDGELCPFTQTAGDATTKIKKLITVETLSFQNGNNEQVFRTTTAVVDNTGTALSAFQKLSFVQDANYVHTDNNFTDAEKNKLAGIEPLAEKNVQADWNESNNLSDSFINNKPIIENVLYKGSVLLGDFPGGTIVATVEVVFPDGSIGTSNYKVRGMMKSNSPEFFRVQDLITWNTADYKEDRFDLIGGSFTYLPNQPQIQNLEFFYEIIAL